MTRGRIMRCALVVLGFLLPCLAQAALIEGITIESADLGSTPGMSPEQAINGSGLPGNTPALSGTHSTYYLAYWWGPDSSPQITVDLEGNYSVDTMHIWNANESNQSDRGLKNVEIYVSPDEDEGNLVKLVTNGTGANDNGSGNFLFPQAPSLSTYEGFSLDLSGITNPSLLNNTRLVRIQALDTHGDPKGGLAEVQFGGISSAPTLLLSNTNVASSAPPGSFVGSLSVTSTEVDRYILLETGDHAYFYIAEGSTNLQTATWMDSDWYDISILATNTSSGFSTATNFTITVTAGAPVFSVVAEVTHPVTEGVVVGTAQASSAGAKFSVVNGRTDLFTFDGAELKATNAALWDGAGATYYVTVRATDGAATDDLIVAVEVVNTVTRGTVFRFR